MELLLLGGDDVRAALDMPDAVTVVREAFRALSSGDATVPLRVGLEMPDGVSLFMPAHLRGGSGAGQAGAKVVSVHGGNPDRGLPAIHALVLLLDPETGRPEALLDGTWLTALRTGAAGGVAADLLARPDARVAAVFGAGVQARTQLQALRAVRPIDEVRIVSRSGTSAEAWAEELGGAANGGPGSLKARSVDDPGDAVRGADVVVAATDSPDPVFPGAAVEPGTHVTGVGSYTPAMREVDETLLRRARIFVDEREAALAEAGELVQALASGVLAPERILGEIGAVVSGELEGRRDPAEITYFKSVGNAVQDVAVAHRIVEVARREGLGRRIEL